MVVLFCRPPFGAKASIRSRCSQVLQLEVVTTNSREMPLERLAKSPIGGAASTISTWSRC